MGDWIEDRTREEERKERLNVGRCFRLSLHPAQSAFLNLLTFGG